MKAEEGMQFKKIKHGNCLSVGMSPIHDQTVCEAAARELGLPDRTVEATDAPGRPEGCYWFEDEGQADFDASKHGLWLSILPQSIRLGAETSVTRLQQWRNPICMAAEAQCGAISEGLDYSGPKYAHIDAIPAPGVCCEKCQADPECGAWTWSRQTRVCWLMHPLQDRSEPRSEKKDGMVAGLPVRRTSLHSLYCVALMQPHSYELPLLQLQQTLRTGLFGCDESKVFSNQVIQIVDGVETGTVESDLKCSMGGDAGTALNTGIFIAFWKSVIETGRFRFHDWTAKVDPDAVFFPDRLRGILHGHPVEGENGVYLNNCKYGLHGPIEVFSRKALETYALNYMKCERKFWFAFSHWGEDLYMDQCLDKALSVERKDEYALICEDHCDCPEYRECRAGAVVFHPFKTVDAYKECMKNAGIPVPP